MTLLHPVRLLLLFIPVALGLLAWRQATRRSSTAVLFAQVELLDHIAPTRTWRRLVPAGLVLAGLALAWKTPGLARRLADEEDEE